MLIFEKVVLIEVMGILKVSSRVVIDGMKVVALAPAVMTMRGSTFHPSA